MRGLKKMVQSLTDKIRITNGEYTRSYNDMRAFFW